MKLIPEERALREAMLSRTRVLATSIEAIKLGKELSYLNQHYGLRFEVSQARGRLRGPLKRLLARAVSGVLSDYFAKETEFHANLVRLENSLLQKVHELGIEVARMFDALEETHFLAQRAELQIEILGERVDAIPDAP